MYYKDKRGKLKYSFKSLIDYDKDKHKTNYRIAKTPFEVLDYYDARPVIDYNTYSIDNVAIDLKKYLNAVSNITSTAALIGIHIYYVLEAETNIVKLSTAAFRQYYRASSTATFHYSINQLIDANVIARAEGKGAYIVNHNLMYKGDLNKFAEQYRLYHGKWEPPKYKENGKVCMKRNNLAREYGRNETLLYDQISKIKDLNITKFSFLKK